jgi:hypothetical protein
MNNSWWTAGGGPFVRLSSEPVLCYLSLNTTNFLIYFGSCAEHSAAYQVEYNVSHYVNAPVCGEEDINLDYIWLGGLRVWVRYG